MINTLLTVGVLEVNFWRSDLNEEGDSDTLCLYRIQKLGSMAIWDRQ